MVTLLPCSIGGLPACRGKEARRVSVPNANIGAKAAVCATLEHRRAKESVRLVVQSLVC